MDSVVFPHFNVVTKSNPKHLPNTVPLKKTDPEAGENRMKNIRRKKKHCGSQKKYRSQLKLVPVPKICLHGRWAGDSCPIKRLLLVNTLTHFFNTLTDLFFTIWFYHKFLKPLHAFFGHFRCGITIIKLS